MKTRVCRYLQSPDANEGSLLNSNYSTKRTAVTALLFEAKRNILLPLIRLGNDRDSRERLAEADSKVVKCSFRGH